MAGVVVFACVLYGLRALRPAVETRPIQEQEVASADLVRVAARLHRRGDPRPFTGRMVESYRIDMAKSRSGVVNGLLEGVSEGWHTNGQLAVREQFRAGVAHGPRLRWYASGSKLSEATIANGKLEGTFRRWHENGRLAEEVEMRDGKPNGAARSFYASGYCKAEVCLRDGKVLEQRFWPDGQVSAPPH